MEVTPEPTRDSSGAWATPETWTCQREQCECKADGAISIQLTDIEDVE